MKPQKAILLFLLLVPAPAMLQGKAKKPYKLPAAFNQARYVYVQAVDGQEFDPRLKPEDLRAIGDVEKAMHDWTRYVLTTQRDQADLVFVVRKGRLAELDARGQVGVGGPAASGRGVRVGSGPGTQAGAGPDGQAGAGRDGQDGSGPTGAPNRTPNDSGRVYGASVGGDVGPRDDLLEVYQPNPNDRLGTLLWQHTLADGLNAPELTLFKQLKDEVERTYPTQTASKSPKP